jgi:excinuclease UvrABC nuclease subunit
MSFDIDFVEEAVTKDYIRKFLLHPDFWIDNSNQIKLTLSWKKIKFIARNLTKIPKQKGVYAFVLQPKYNNFPTMNYLFYVGKTNRTLKIRFSEYLKEKDGIGKPRKKIHKMLNRYDNYLYFYFAPIINKTDVNESEERLLNTFVPHVNTAIPKAKIKNELKNIYE